MWYYTCLDLLNIHYNYQRLKIEHYSFKEDGFVHLDVSFSNSPMNLVYICIKFHRNKITAKSVSISVAVKWLVSIYQVN